jgi:hypothetical protein
MHRHRIPSTATAAVGFVGVAIGLTIALVLAPVHAGACDTAIRIAPETLNLGSSGTVVTVHTDVPYSDVDVYSVFLSGVAIDAWKADDRGFFVAKFLMDEIKAINGLVLNDVNTFTLVAMTINGDPICGEAEVFIIDRGPQPAGAGRTASDR